MVETYYTFLVNNLLDFCEIIDPLTNLNINDPYKYLNIYKRYKMISCGRDPQSKFYNKYIPYYKLCPIIEVENKKILMIYYQIENKFMIDSISIHDELGVSDIQQIDESEEHHDDYVSQWLFIEEINLTDKRNKIINNIFNIKEEDIDLFD
jgi:hypothetical protein